MKNSNDTMNRTRDLPACSAVPKSAALPRAPNVGIVSKPRPTTDSFHILPIHYSIIILSLHITQSEMLTASTEKARTSK
jgi:hypothetical protein